MSKNDEIILQIQHLISTLNLKVPYSQIYFEKKEEHYNIKTPSNIINHRDYYNNNYICFCSNLSVILGQKNYENILIFFENNLVSNIESIDFDNPSFKKDYFLDLNPIIKRLIDSVFDIFLSGNYLTSEENRIQIMKLVLSTLITLKIKETFKFLQYLLYLAKEIYKLDDQDSLDFFYNETSHPYFEILINKTNFAQDNIFDFWFDSIITNKNLDSFKEINIDLNKHLNAKINREKTIIQCYKILDKIKEKDNCNLTSINDFEKTHNITTNEKENMNSNNSIPIFLCDDKSFQGTSKRRQNIFQQLLKNKNKLLKNPTDVENKLEKLKQEFPNFGQVISHIQEEYILNQTSTIPYFYFSPILLSGEPGIGKTFFSDRLCQIIDIPKYFFNSGANSTGFVLNGHSEGWANGQEGFIFKSLMHSQFANPLIVFDEIDKISIANNQYPVDSVYLSLLEEHTAKNFTDEYFEFGADCSYINIIGTANDVFKISSPLLSRFTLFEIPLPNLEERIIFSKSILKKIVDKKNIQLNFSSIPYEFWAEVCKEKGSLRDIDKTLKRSLVNSLRRNKDNVILYPEDINNYQTKTSLPIGFLN